MSAAHAPMLRRSCACGGKASGSCACDDKKKTVRRHARRPGPSTAPPIVEEVLRSPGQLLDAAARQEMEARLGHDFSRVRVHTDAQAAASADAVQAEAYTVGPHVAFASGRYVPSAPAGRRLLAHELAHVAQQGGDGSGLSAPLEVGSPSDPLERQADRAADAALSGGGAGASASLSGGGPAVLQRQAAGRGESSAPRPRPPERLENVGRGGARFNAELDHVRCLLTNTMRLQFRFVNTPQRWPSEDRQREWTTDFVERVTSRWSGRYDLEPNPSPCRHETCGRLAVLLRAVPVASSPHFTVTVGYTDAPETSGVNQAAHTATLDSLDTSERDDIAQVPAEHEFGHMLGLSHVHCDGNEDVCYGVDDVEKANIMGGGHEVSTRDYGVFAEVAERFSNCGWRPVATRSALPGILIGGLGGALVGAGVGALFGPVGMLVGGLIGAGLGALIGGLV